MKLRLQANSIRLRLKRLEVEQLACGGRVEEKILFGPKDEAFLYVLEASCGVTRIEARFQPHGIVVEVPAAHVAHWATSEQVGIEGFQIAGDSAKLHILIEKDFACLNGSDDQNIDTFPNPLAGTKC
jgi:hypothetical protein